MTILHHPASVFRPEAAESGYCWVLTDGSVGMDNQGLAVAEAVGLPVLVKHAKRSGPWRFLPTALQLKVPPGLLLRDLTPESDDLTPPWPKLLISVGRQSVALALAIRVLAGGRTFALHIQNPTVPSRLFDLVAAPAHDGMDEAVALHTLGAPHRVTAARLAAEAGLYAKPVESLPHPRVAVLLGGNSRAFRFDEETARHMGESLKALMAKTGGALLVTPSRRTPPAALAALKTALGPTPMLFWDGTEPNPYFSFLALADTIIATADSVNMVTEAAGTGKPVYVYPLPGHSARIAAFHAAMQAHGATRPYDGTLAAWSYPPVNDTERIAAVVRQRLGIG
jgi:mitochondrial fission protein ELM1